MNSFKVPIETRRERVDAVLASAIDGLSRSNIKNRIIELYVNGEKCKLSRKVGSGDIVEYSIKDEVDINISAEDVPLDIIYEDDNVFVINKPQGMVVHPAAGNYSGTMAQGILYRLLDGETDFSENDKRPGIVHRLDKDTSGIIIAAKNSYALDFLSEQFRKRAISKTYLAVINGKLPESKGRIESLIGRDPKNRKRMTWNTLHGKSASTDYRVLKQWDEKSLVALSPKTGRTHQLRVHMLKMKTPILGDPVYARKTEGCTLMLHAYKLRIILPGDDAVSEFRAPLPERFKSVIKTLSEKD